MHDTQGFKDWLAPCLYYASHLVWIYLLWAAWRWRKTRSASMLAWRLTLAGLFVWMRFAEPQWIIERQATLPALATAAPALVAEGGPQARPAPNVQSAGAAGTRLVLISDLHLGSYKDPDFIGRAAARINALHPDCVLIAGDFLYAPRDTLDALFAGLRDFKVPAYAVLGNHDSRELGWRQGGDVEHDAIAAALERAGVKVIENQVITCGGIAVAGIGDRWSGRENFEAALAYRGSAPLVLLTHNPDTAYSAPKGLSRLLLAGHTHGGQIRLPFIYRYVIPVHGPFDRGLLKAVEWSDDPLGRPDVFVTSGLGEIGLPMRLLNPPAIDILQL